MPNEAISLSLSGIPQRFVAGLTWRHEDKKPSLKQIRSLATSYGRYFTKRKAGKGSWQVGFSDFSGSVQHKVKVYAIASIVADAKGGTWRGLWKLGSVDTDDVYLYIAIRDGEVIPDGDVIGTRDDVAHAKALHSEYGWQEEVDGDANDLLKLVAPTKFGSNGVFIDVKNPIDYFRYIAWSLTFALIVGGGFSFHLWQNKKALEKTEHEAMLKKVEEARLRALPPSWYEQPNPQDFIVGCKNVWVNQRLWVNGWKMSRWTCRQSRLGKISVDVSWIRGGGLASGAPGVLDKKSSGGSSLETFDRDIVFSKTGLHQGVVSEDTMLRRIYSMGQSLGFTTEIDGHDAGVVALPGVASFVSGTPDDGKNSGTLGKLHTAVMRLPFDPFISGFAQEVGGLSPNFRITEIYWNSTSWSVDGRFYTE